MKEKKPPRFTTEELGLTFITKQMQKIKIIITIYVKHIVIKH